MRRLLPLLVGVGILVACLAVPSTEHRDALGTPVKPIELGGYHYVPLTEHKSDSVQSSVTRQDSPKTADNTPPGQVVLIKAVDRIVWHVDPNNTKEGYEEHWCDETYSDGSTKSVLLDPHLTGGAYTPCAYEPLH